MDIAFPFQIDDRGLIASTDYESHVRQLIEQVLLTVPGERVNRPQFGSGLMRFVFASPTSEVLTATQAMIQGELQRWLSHVIQVKTVLVQVQQDVLQVTVAYVLLQRKQHYTATFNYQI